MGSCAFQECKAKVIFESGSKLVTIGTRSFKDFAGTIEIPSTVETIGYEAFADASGVVTFAPNSTLRNIKQSAFERYPFEIVVPPSVRVIGPQAFAGASKVRLAPGSQLETLGSHTFSCFWKWKLLDCAPDPVTVPETVRKIHQAAFWHYPGNVMFEGGSKIELIGQNAFADYAGM